MIVDPPMDIFLTQPVQTWASWVEYLLGINLAPLETSYYFVLSSLVFHTTEFYITQGWINHSTNLHYFDACFALDILQLKLLKRIATVKDDGTVEFEIPGDEESRVLGVESQSVSNEVEDEPLDEIELHYIPPMQIVMLIVGTRGDVQPFIAIGKRLQVPDIILQSQILYLQAVSTLYMHYTYVF